MKKSNVTKVYITTDGYFTDRSDIKKRRVVAVLEQRNSDGAVAVVKVFSKEGKEANIGKTFIPGLTLLPQDHSTLTQESIVGRQVQFGVKHADKTYTPIFLSDMVATEDRLTRSELRRIRKEVHNDTRQHRKTYKDKKKKWQKSFK